MATLLSAANCQVNTVTPHTEVRANQLDITVKLDALLGCDLVLCCADEPDDLPNIVQKHCAENGLAYLNAGYIGRSQ